jgi:hypothetical protein
VFGTLKTLEGRGVQGKNGCCWRQFFRIDILADEQRNDRQSTRVGFTNQAGALDWKQAVSGEGATLYGLPNIQESGVVLAYRDGVQG